MRSFVDDSNISRQKVKMEDVSDDLDLSPFSHTGTGSNSHSVLPIQSEIEGGFWSSPYHISRNYALGSSWIQENQVISSMDPHGIPVPRKRAKFWNHSMTCYSHTASGYGTDTSNTCEAKDHSVSGGSQIPGENMTVIYYHSDNSVDNHMDSDIEGNDGDDSSNSDKDNCELRMDLTEDLLHMVFSFLSHRYLCKAGSTCKTWHSASTHEDFWRILNFRNLNITPENFAAICCRYPNATLVNVLGVPHFNVLVMEVTSPLRKLETFSFGKGRDS